MRRSDCADEAHAHALHALAAAASPGLGAARDDRRADEDHQNPLALRRGAIKRLFGGAILY